MKIRSDSPITQKALAKLIKAMRDNGAWFHENLTLTSENNGLLVELDGPCNPQETVIKVPTTQLIPVAPLNQ